MVSGGLIEMYEVATDRVLVWTQLLIVCRVIHIHHWTAAVFICPKLQMC